MISWLLVVFSLSINNSSSPQQLLTAQKKKEIKNEEEGKSRQPVQEEKLKKSLRLSVYFNKYNYPKTIL